jgi:hypothetical protein
MTYCRICTAPTVAVGPEDHEVLCRNCFTAAVQSVPNGQPIATMQSQELGLLIQAASPAPTLLPDSLFTPELSAQLQRFTLSRRPPLSATWVNGQMIWRLEQHR